MSVSVVIPAYNEEAHIGVTLDALIDALNSEVDVHEVTVVNNSSQDSTGEIVARYKNVKQISLVDKVTVAQARNIGWHSSLHEIVVFLDADITITGRWIEALKEFATSARPLVSGYKVGASQRPSWLDKYWFSSLKRSASLNYINSGNLITTRTVLDTIEGFDEALVTGEDVDFCRRARQAGFEVQPREGFDVFHEGYPRTLKRFIEREIWHGKGDMKNIKAFLGSKICLFALGMAGLLCTAAISAAFKVYPLAIASSMLFCALNTIFIFSRFNISGVKHFAIAFFLNLIYLGARLSSFFKRKVV